MTRRGSRLVLAILAAAVALPATASGATIQVTTVTDELGTGAGCSLREALVAANSNSAVGGCRAGAGGDVVALPAGIFQLTRPGQVEDGGQSGDLDVSSTVTIHGAGRGRSVIDARGIDRVLDVGFDASLTVERVTVTGGHTHNGVHGNPVSTGGEVTQPGGGINNLGVLTVSDSEVVDNRTGDGGAGFAVAGAAGGDGGGTGLTELGGTGGHSGLGGGIYSGGTLTVIRSTIAGNATGRGGDGGASTGGTGGGGVAGNPGGTGGLGHAGDGGASGEGGGIAAPGGALTIIQSRITDNATGRGGRAEPGSVDRGARAARPGGPAAWAATAGAGRAASQVRAAACTSRSANQRSRTRQLPATAPATAARAALARAAGAAMRPPATRPAGQAATGPEVVAARAVPVPGSSRGPRRPSRARHSTQMRPATAASRRVPPVATAARRPGTAAAGRAATPAATTARPAGRAGTSTWRRTPAASEPGQTSRSRARPPPRAARRGRSRGATGAPVTAPATAATAATRWAARRAAARRAAVSARAGPCRSAT